MTKRYYEVQGPKEFTAWTTVFSGYDEREGDDLRQIARELVERREIHTDADRWRVRVFPGVDRDDIGHLFVYGVEQANEDGLYCGNGAFDARHDIKTCPGMHSLGCHE